MSSESKKRKADCDTHNRKCRFTNGFALKWKGKGKGWMFFNSSQRMTEKEAFRKEVENLTPPNKGPSYVPKQEVTIYIKGGEINDCREETGVGETSCGKH